MINKKIVGMFYFEYSNSWRDKLFDRFYKSDKSRHVNSTGLGLSIVKEMVEVLGWNIKAYKKEDILSIEINCL